MYVEKKLSIHELLERVLAHEDEILEEQTIEAFRGMKLRMEDTDLTAAQQEWVAGVYKERDLQRHYNENLMSKGKIARGKKMPELWWEKPENRPLKPPGV